MGNKLVITVRFHAEGTEAELYRKLQEGKEHAGLSVPEYVKKILSEYVADGEKRGTAEQILQEIRQEYREMIERVERTIRRSIQEHDVILLGVLSKIGGTTAVSESRIDEKRDDAKLPEEGAIFRKARWTFWRIFDDVAAYLFGICLVLEKADADL